MHVLVTGGAGFIGSHIVEHHLAKGDQIHVVDDLSTGSLANLQPFLDHPGFRFDEADILIWDGLAQAAAWADRIYHMAAVVGMYRVLEEPIQVLATNVAGTERLLRATLAGGWRPQVLIASSSEVYGPMATEELEEGADLHIRSGAVIRWNYAVSKLTDEALALSYYRKHNLPITIARLFNTIGPRQTARYGMVVPNFVRQALDGAAITVFGDGDQTRCFCDARDTVVFFDRLLDNPAAHGEIVNVGNEREVTIRELAEMVRRQTESSSPIRTVPYAEAYGEGFEDIHRRKPVLRKLYELTGHRHRYSLEDTLAELIQERRAQVDGLASMRLAQEV
jgi:UDP-glucose 4-epimerase